MFTLIHTFISFRGGGVTGTTKMKRAFFNVKRGTNHGCNLIRITSYNYFFIFINSIFINFHYCQNLVLISSGFPIMKHVKKLSQRTCEIFNIEIFPLGPNLVLNFKIIPFRPVFFQKHICTYYINICKIKNKKI